MLAEGNEKDLELEGMSMDIVNVALDGLENHESYSHYLLLEKYFMSKSLSGSSKKSFEIKGYKVFLDTKWFKLEEP
jgi:hypothetical protein